MAFERCFNVEDFRARALRRLPAPLFHYIDGGADDEWTLRRNVLAFEAYGLIPEQLRNVAAIDTRATLLGRECALPLMLAPTGMSGLFHHEKEIGAARAASRFGVPYALSTLGTTTMEEIAGATQGMKIFQIYIFKDRGLTREFVERARASGFDALCLTVDMAMAGNRERDYRTGMTMPPRFTPSSLMDFACRPDWLMHYVLGKRFTLANVAHRVDALKGGTMPLIDYVNSQFDRTVGWDDVRWLAESWNGPLIVKGLLSAEDSRRARDAGAHAIMISNHGGRQLDGVPAPIECVAPIREAVGASLQLIVDGGVRRGTHVLKALALGADAVSFGRPYLYALAAGGRAGVERLLALFKAEIERGMTLLGCASLGEIKPHHVTRL